MDGADVRHSCVRRTRCGVRAAQYGMVVPRPRRLRDPGEPNAGNDKTELGFGEMALRRSDHRFGARVRHILAVAFAPRLGGYRYLRCVHEHRVVGKPFGQRVSQYFDAESRRGLQGGRRRESAAPSDTRFAVARRSDDVVLRRGHARRRTPDGFTLSRPGVRGARPRHHGAGRGSDGVGRGLYRFQRPGKHGASSCDRLGGFGRSRSHRRSRLVFGACVGPGRDRLRLSGGQCGRGGGTMVRIPHGCLAMRPGTESGGGSVVNGHGFRPSSGDSGAAAIRAIQ